LCPILTRQYEHVHTRYVSNPGSGLHDLLREIMNRLGIEARPLRADRLLNPITIGRHIGVIPGADSALLEAGIPGGGPNVPDLTLKIQ
jgi:hypothetical protein